MCRCRTSIVEAIKATGWFAADRTGQAISLVLGTALGTVAGWLAMYGAGENDPIWIGVGAIAGLIGPLPRSVVRHQPRKRTPLQRK